MDVVGLGVGLLGVGLLGVRLLGAPAPKMQFVSLITHSLLSKANRTLKKENTKRNKTNERF